MTSNWDEARIATLTDDPGLLLNGKKLAVTAKWLRPGMNEQAIWGECQGSGKQPYRVCIDLATPAYECTCPSHKIPCKHTLGLFFLFANQSTFFPKTSPPEWVAAWLESQQKRRLKPPVDKSKPVDAAAQAKRNKAREAKVNAGLEELQLWLRDLVRRGLADEQVKTYEFWDRIAARMVDAQAAGIAGRLRNLAGLPFQGRWDWAERLLDEIARLYLLADSYMRIDDLPAETRADIRTLIGWTYKQNELVEQPPVRDTWTVMSESFDMEDRLRMRRVWLHGNETAQKTLLLDFAHGNTPFESSYPVGTVFVAELVYYPGTYPQRAIIKNRYGRPKTPIDPLCGYDCLTIAEALERFADGLACNPWLEGFPVGLQAVIPYKEGDHSYVRDSNGQILPLVPRPSAKLHPWLFQAASGNQPLPMFGEWNGYEFRPLVIYADGIFFAC